MSIFKLYNENKNLYPVIINIPHSGILIPKDVELKFIYPRPVISNTDWFLDELYDFLIHMNVTIIAANYSRYVVDLNRTVNNNLYSNDYNKSVIYEKTIWKRDLYQDKLSDFDCIQRLDKYYYPYHNKLRELIENKLEKFDNVLLLDLHSGFTSTGNADICLANANGEMSKKQTINFLKEQLNNQGYTVNINNPVTSGKVLREYSNKYKNLECILFEINYNKYIRTGYIGEEEIKEYDSKLFKECKNKLEISMIKFLESINL